MNAKNLPAGCGENNDLENKLFTHVYMLSNSGTFVNVDTSKVILHNVYMASGVESSIKTHTRSEFRAADADPALRTFIDEAVTSLNERNRKKHGGHVEVQLPAGTDRNAFIFFLASNLVSTYGYSFAVVNVENLGIHNPGEAEDPDPAYTAAVEDAESQATTHLKKLQALGNLGFAFVIEPLEIGPAEHQLKTHIQSTLVDLEVPALYVRSHPVVSTEVTGAGQA